MLNSDTLQCSGILKLTMRRMQKHQQLMTFEKLGILRLWKVLATGNLLSPQQCREWIAILQAQRQLYNVDKLMSVEVSEFKTKTFMSLLKLPEVEQVS